MLANRTKVEAKKSELKYLDKNNLLLVRPSVGNMHKFVAEEDSCFFDICLPNYTTDSLRRITYFNEISEEIGGDSGSKGTKRTLLEYNTTPPVMPVGFDVAEIDYIGDNQEAGKTFGL